ncbi:Uncharacterised protein [uncultured Clostridium sp.]|nr:Uncharacterised protein [uncultured Clostridium sp.]
MVTYGWGIFIVFMVSILLLAAIGMLYLLRSLYPFNSKYEIACVIACGIVMILAVFFSAYGVKKLVAPERQVETQHETEVATESTMETETETVIESTMETETETVIESTMETETEREEKTDSKNTVEAGAFVIFSVVIVWLIYFGFLLSESDFDAVGLALQIMGIITLIAFAFAIARVDSNNYSYLFVCICIYFVLSAVAGYFLWREWNGNEMAVIFVVLAVLSALLVLGTYKDFRKEIPMRESTRRVIYVDE